MSKRKLFEKIHTIIKPGKSLSQRTIKAGFWMFLLKLVRLLFSFTRIIILARILAPDDFGLMSIAFLTMSILETFTQTGLHSALIQKKGNINEYLDTVWTILIVRGFVLFSLLYIISPLAASFFNAPHAKSIIQVIGLSVLFQAFTNIGMIYFKKELELSKEVIYQFVGTTADFVVAIVSVFLLRNVWALVLGLLAGSMAQCFVSYLVHPYRPRFTLRLEKARSLFGFGKWILGSSVLIFCLSQGDDIVVGKLLGTAALGYYHMAYMISNMPSTEIANVISPVVFSTYSKLQDDLASLKEAYIRVLQITSLMSFPVAGLIFVLAPECTRIFLGDKWMPMVPAMQILSLLGLLRAIVVSIGPVFMSMGKPKIGTQLSMMQLLVLIILFYPLTLRWGIVGMSLAVVLTNVASYWGIRKTLKLIDCQFKIFIGSWSCQLIGTIGMCLLLQISKNIYHLNYAGIIVLMFAGLLAYAAITYFLDQRYGSSKIKESVAMIKTLAYGGNN